MTVLAAAWLVLLLVSPYLVSHAGAALRTLAGLVYLAGAVVCHQRPERSFHAWGVQMPVCARCAGLYASAVAGGLFAAFSSARRAGAVAGRHAFRADWALRLAVAAAPTAASVALEIAGLWRQSPAMRCVAALPLGFGVGWFVAAHAAEVIGCLSAVARARRENGRPARGRV